MFHWILTPSGTSYPLGVNIQGTLCLLVVNYYLTPANEVCEGYVFTCVCHSVRRGWVSRPRPRVEVKVSGWGVSRPTLGGVQAYSRGGGVQAHTEGGGVSQHALRQTPPADGYCCGRYASYWNAFLFSIRFAENCIKMKKKWTGVGAHISCDPLDPPLFFKFWRYVSHF